MKTALLVDDDYVTNFLNKKILENLGMYARIDTAPHGKAALEMLINYSQSGLPLPDLILLDLNMPVMGGFDFLQEFRQLDLPGIEKVKIIVSSSSDYVSDLQKAKALGVKYYFTKPFNTEELMHLSTGDTEQLEKFNMMRKYGLAS
jgi:CheY-like chemotaxis protein